MRKRNLRANIIQKTVETKKIKKEQKRKEALPQKLIDHNIAISKDPSPRVTSERLNEPGEPQTPLVNLESTKDRNEIQNSNILEERLIETRILSSEKSSLESLTLGVGDSG